MRNGEGINDEEGDGAEEKEREKERKRARDRMTRKGKKRDRGPLVVQWLRLQGLSSQCKGPRFNLWSGNWIPHATTKEPTCHKDKYPMCCNEDLAQLKK